MINASGYLPLHAYLWSTQWDRDSKRHHLTPIRFKPKIYLSEILRQNTRAIPGPDINPNNTLSAARQEAENKLDVYAPLHRVPLLILGERGVGKSTLIRKHFHERLLPDLSYHELACGTFREELFRAELFGYQKGAFTGAERNQPGLLADFDEGGLLFLDEIHDLPLSLQRDLIQVLQTGKYYPIGSREAKKAVFRLVTASNRSLSDLSDPSCLAPDFFDRVVHLTLNIPPLRECREDLRHYWEVVWRQLDENQTIPWNDALAQMLATHPLPSNFRDLQRLAAHILAFSLSGGEDAIGEGIQAFEAFYKQIEFVSANSLGYFQPDTTFKEMEARFRKDLTQEAEAHYGSIKKAAEILDKSPASLYQYRK